ncbi:unnamed protein product [Staurois parvus]|uniref:Uncharacterized protein n=1 Tax=Staurois parvus TaxID=386267 RepID=A0ABN9HFV1_9NEOB|nr:unnamed protein product [Staurois parvus]
MSPLQRPQPSPPADAGIRLPGSVHCECWDIRGTEPVGNSKMLNKI